MEGMKRNNSGFESRAGIGIFVPEGIGSGGYKSET